MTSGGFERAVLRRRRLVGIGWAAALIVSAAIGWWAASATLRPSETVPETAPTPVVVRAIEGRVGKTLDFSATSSWSTLRETINSAQGMVTAVYHAPATTAKAGDVLYAVDLHPVVAIKGSVPMFRDLSEGLRGPDVEQLRAFLMESGYMTKAGTSFDAAMAKAADRWLNDLGIAFTGTIGKGSILFLPDLPARTTLSQDIAVGKVLASGVGSVLTLSAEPAFAMRLTPDQANLVPLDASVLVGPPGGPTWSTRMGPAKTDREGQIVIPLLAAATGSVCGADCALLEGATDTVLTAKVVIVAETAGVTLPRAAIRSSPDGSQHVVIEGGALVAVKVLAESGGTAVVDGVVAGTPVELPAGP